MDTELRELINEILRRHDHQQDAHDLDVKLIADWHQQEIAKANSEVTANELLNHIADGMSYDETFTFNELEAALGTLKEHKEE